MGVCITGEPWNIRGKNISWVPTKAVLSKLKRASWKLEPSRASFLVLWVAVGGKEAWRGQGGSVGTLHYDRLETRTIYVGC